MQKRKMNKLAHSLISEKISDVRQIYDNNYKSSVSGGNLI